MAAPQAAVLNGTSSWIHLDGLAQYAYGAAQVESRHILLAKIPAVTAERLLLNLADNAASGYPRMTDRNAASNDALRSVVQQSGPITQDATSSAALAVADGDWHMIQWGQRLTAGTMRAYFQVDGITREGPHASTYAPFAWTPDWLTLGAIRYGSGPTVAAWQQCELGYYALQTDEQLASWDDPWDAYDTGGGKNNLGVVSQALLDSMTTGTIRWAGALDGSDPDVDPHSVGAPTFNDVTFVPAGY